MFHNLVKEALIHEGWNITNDPYALKAGDIDYEVDLGAEKLIVASKGVTKILVEVKSFLRQSTTHEMHGALGQYNTYFLALQEQEP
ncbi:MAG: element excision factor XisH family protein, partial [Saprospiraceae bacterium]